MRWRRDPGSVFITQGERGGGNQILIVKAQTGRFGTAGRASGYIWEPTPSNKQTQETSSTLWQQPVDATTREVYARPQTGRVEPQLELFTQIGGVDFLKANTSQLPKASLSNNWTQNRWVSKTRVKKDAGSTEVYVFKVVFQCNFFAVSRLGSTR